MGEYAKNYKGQQIKIGTCESMYYLRYDQRFLVQALPGNVDPVADAAELRFRFPFPDEDHQAPGTFHDQPFERGLVIPGAGCAHAGRPVALTAQRYRPGIGVVPVLKCDCHRDGNMWRLEDRDEIEALAVQIRSEADRQTDETTAKFWHTIADRVLTGINNVAFQSEMIVRPNDPMEV